MASQRSRWDMDPKNLLPLPPVWTLHLCPANTTLSSCFPGSPSYAQDNLVTVSSLAPQQPSSLSLPSKSRLPTQSVLLRKVCGEIYWWIPGKIFLSERTLHRKTVLLASSFLLVLLLREDTEPSDVASILRP